MNRSLLIPVCLISALAGQALPRMLEGPSLTLGAAAFLTILLAVDAVARRLAGRRARS